MPHFCTLIAAFDVVFHLSDIVLRRCRALDYIQHGGCDWNVLALKPAIMYWMWRNDLPGNDVYSQCVIANTHVFYVPTKFLATPNKLFGIFHYIFLSSCCFNSVLPLKHIFFGQVQEFKGKKTALLFSLGFGLNGIKLDKNTLWDRSSRRTIWRRF
jgi:hypothetical protein